MFSIKERSREKRSNDRTKCERGTEFVVDNLPYYGQMKNVSIEGAFIETNETFPAGQVIQLKFNSYKDGAEITLRGEVIRNGRKGIGVRFI